MIIRWVITTILFSEKKRQYITTILSLSSETQFYLQCIIETVMNAFPQDDANSSALSEMHTILEESSISLDNDQASFSLLENSRMELRSRFEGLLFSLALFLTFRRDPAAGVEADAAPAAAVLRERRVGITAKTARRPPERSGEAGIGAALPAAGRERLGRKRKAAEPEG